VSNRDEKKSPATEDGITIFQKDLCAFIKYETKTNPLRSGTTLSPNNAMKTVEYWVWARTDVVDQAIVEWVQRKKESTQIIHGFRDCQMEFRHSAKKAAAERGA
jgi:hypothetical protein